MRSFILSLFLLASFVGIAQTNIGIYPLATASGTDTYTVTVTPAFSTYTTGQRFNIKFTNANTGAATININSKGAKSIVEGGTVLTSGDIKTGEIKLLQYDGANMQIIGGSTDLGVDRHILEFPGNTTNTATLFSEIVEINDGRLLGLFSVFGATLGDFSEFTLKGSYSSDGGKTWGTPFLIIGKEGTEVANSIPSIHKQANGTLVMLFWRDLVDTNPRKTQIRKKVSTDNGLTWTASTLVYDIGAYSAPHGSRIFKANDGTLYYAFNEWTGGPGPTDFNYGSQNGNYKGRLLKSIDDGTTWTLVAVEIIDTTTNLIAEPGLFQFPNAADGTAGRAYMYYRTRGDRMGWAFSDDNFVTWSTGGPSTLAAHNVDLNAKYFPDLDAIVVSHGRIAPWGFRANDISVSYDRGTNWYRIFTLSEVPSGYRTATSPIFLFKDLLLFPYYKSNATQTVYDEYLFYSNISAFTSVNPASPLPLYSGKTNTITAPTRFNSTGSLSADIFLVGKDVKDDPNDLLSVNNTTSGTRVVFGNDVNANGITSLLKFSKTRAGAAPNNGDEIGLIHWNNRIQISAEQNVDALADLYFGTDQLTGGAFIKKTKFLPTGQWVYGDAGNLNPMLTSGLATFRATGRNTQLSIGNADNNSNLSEIYFEKKKGSSFTLTAGDVITQFSYNTLAYIKAVANGTVVAGNSHIDFAFWGADAAGTVAERVRITGPGDLKLNTVGTGLYIKEGANATMGTATLVAGTVTVSNTKVTANSRISLTVQSLGTVTSPKAVAITARTAGTSFTITSADATDTSVVMWHIIEGF